MYTLAVSLLVIVALSAAGLFALGFHGDVGPILSGIGPFPNPTALFESFSYTPVITNITATGTVVPANGSIVRRIGTALDITGNLTIGSGGTSLTSFDVSLPAGYGLDSASIVSATLELASPNTNFATTPAVLAQTNGIAQGTGVNNTIRFTFRTPLVSGQTGLVGTFRATATLAAPGAA